MNAHLCQRGLLPGIALLAATGVGAQPVFVRLWTDPGPLNLRATAQAAQGERLLAGSLAQEPWLAGADTSGNPTWALSLPTYGEFLHVAPRPPHNGASSASWSVAARIGSSWRSEGVLVAALTARGDFLWQRLFPQLGEPVGLGWDSSGVFFAANPQESSGLGGPVLVRLAEGGVVLWARELSPPPGRLLGACSSPAGAALVLGELADASPVTGFVALVAPSGVVRWARQLPNGASLSHCAWHPGGWWVAAGLLREESGELSLWAVAVSDQGELTSQLVAHFLLPLFRLTGMAASSESTAVVGETAPPYNRAFALFLDNHWQQPRALALTGGRALASGAPHMGNSHRLFWVGTSYSTPPPYASGFVAHLGATLQDFHHCPHLAAWDFRWETSTLTWEPLLLSLTVPSLTHRDDTLMPIFQSAPNEEEWCVDKSTPVPDLAVEGHVATAGEGELWQLEVSVRNVGELTARQPTLWLNLATGGRVPTFPPFYPCVREILSHGDRVTCWLEDLEPGQGVVVNFSLQGSLFQLRNGSLGLFLSQPEADTQNNHLPLRDLFPNPVRRRLPPAGGGQGLGWPTNAGASPLETGQKP